ncbi:MAG: RagB/SusD family nutrient uptake outer membrane protein [Prevotellamassilia sp.]|nr:RagB/SusD family nutrient uptake outer membrane protein [Prevotellamassilia sp.]
MRTIITYLCSCIVFAYFGILSSTAQEIGTEMMHVFSKKNGYKTLPITQNTLIEFLTDEPLDADFKLNELYRILNYSSTVNLSNSIQSHMTCGLGGIMMLSNNTSNDVSHYFKGGDPWHFDKQLEYYGQDYIRASGIWNLFYNVINSANEVITLEEEENHSEVNNAAIGQSLALRALSYFYLAQFYQHTYITSQDMPCVPLMLTASEDSIQGRATVEQVYEQIVEDLRSAIDLLDGWQRESKMQIDKQVAQGILARVYLVMHKWNEAIEMAQAAREGYPLMTAEEAYQFNYQDISNQEVIWGVDITSQTSMIYASFQSWMCAQYYGYGGQVGAFQLIDAKLYNSIPNNDARKYLYVAPGDEYPCEGWKIPPYGNLKFKIEGAEDFLGDVIYMRSSEMYLTEAEALVCLGRADEANAVLSEFMSNRILEGEWGIKRATIEVVQNQRRVELWGEGFSYFDHRRWQMDMNRDYEGTNESPSTWPTHFENGYVPWWHYSWRFQLPKSQVDKLGLEQNPIGEEGNQDPVFDLIEIYPHNQSSNAKANYSSKYSSRQNNATPHAIPGLIQDGGNAKPVSIRKMIPLTVPKQNASRRKLLDPNKKIEIINSLEQK